MSLCAEVESSIKDVSRILSPHKLTPTDCAEMLLKFHSILRKESRDNPTKAAAAERAIMVTACDNYDAYNHQSQDKGNDFLDTLRTQSPSFYKEFLTYHHGTTNPSD